MTDEQKQHIQKWVEALRSGKYKKVEGELYHDGEYCALGVACEVYRQETGEGQWTDRGTFALDAGYGNGGDLPVQVAKWYGFTSDLHVDTDPEICLDLPDLPDACATVSEFNDGSYAIGVDPVSFEVIAGGIEEKYLKESE